MCDIDNIDGYQAYRRAIREHYNMVRRESVVKYSPTLSLSWPIMKAMIYMMNN